MLKQVLRLCCLSLAAFLPVIVYAQDARTERVSGVYKIVKIDKKDSEDVTIRFEADSKLGKYSTLTLRSDQVQLGLREGQVFRLSAEVVSSKSDTHEITQVLIFLPSSEFGAVPIWLLSNRFGPQDIRGARWIEMHAPQADYRIF